jgi:predicted ribosome quality control (RQC) complex YloA/Tae2 family protein
LADFGSSISNGNRFKDLSTSSKFEVSSSQENVEMIGGVWSLRLCQLMPWEKRMIDDFLVCPAKSQKSKQSEIAIESKLTTKIKDLQATIKEQMREIK